MGEQSDHKKVSILGEGITNSIFRGIQSPQARRRRLPEIGYCIQITSKVALVNQIEYGEAPSEASRFVILKEADEIA